MNEQQQQWQIGSLIGGGWRGIGFDHIRLSHQSVSHGGVLQKMRPMQSCRPVGPSPGPFNIN